MKGNTWKYIAGGIFVVAGTVILFPPLITTASEVSETFNEIEVILEPYSITEPYTDEVVNRQSSIIIDECYEIAPVGNYGAVYGDGFIASGVAYIGTVKTPIFTIDRPDARLIGLFENPVPGTLTIINAQNRTIVKENGSHGTIDVAVPEGKYHAKFKENVAWDERGTYENECHIHLEVEIVNLEQVTRYKEVTKYHKVPVQIEKQKEVTKYHKVSIMEWLLKH